MIKRLFLFAIIIFLTIPVVFPLFSKTILGSADNLAHLFRVVNLNQALAEGYIWPRWAGLEGHGYGAPIFNFNYMLAYYILVLFWRILGSLLFASQFFMAFTIVGSSIAMFLFLRNYFRPIPAMVGSIVYAYLPYHLLTIYLYGGYGEALAFLWLPLLAAVIFYLTQKNYIWPFLACVIITSLLILSHNLSAVFSVPIILSLGFLHVFKSNRHKLLLKIILNYIFALGITCWFWLPSIAEEHFTKLSVLFAKEAAIRGYFFSVISPVIENSIKLLKLESPDYYSYAIGIPTVLIVGITIFIICFNLLMEFIYNRNKTKPAFITWVGIYFIFWFIVSFFMTRKISEPLWDIIPTKLNFLSYPARFFFINSFAVAGIVAFFIEKCLEVISIKKYLFIVVPVIFFFLWQGYMYTNPAIDRFSFPESYFSSDQTVRTAPGTHKNMGYIEFIPNTTESDFINGTDSEAPPGKKVEVVAGDAMIKILSQKTQDIVMSSSAQNPSRIMVNTLYFPGWIGFTNGKLVRPLIDSVGRMLFDLPAGNTIFKLTFSDTPVRTMANIISIIFSLIFIWIFTVNLSKIIFKR